MSQKVWVIDDQGWKGATGKGKVETPPPAERRLENRPLSRAPEKSPAVSFSLSMLVWGSGQMYIGAYGPGAIFMAAMFFFCSTASTLVFYRDVASRLVAETGIQPSVFVNGAFIFIFAGLVCWLANAADAYYRAAKLRSEPFRGVDNEFWPLLCSLLFPGWGQFLNGQPKKGISFFLFGMTGIFSVLISAAAPYVWPVLKISSGRSVYEVCFAAALLCIPLSFLLWIVSAYDAFRSCRKLFMEKLRTQYAGYRMQSQGVMRGLIPRSTVVLGLLLAISVGMQWIPRQYYRDSMEQIRMAALNNDMEMIPELVRKINDFIGG